MWWSVNVSFPFFSTAMVLFLYFIVTNKICSNVCMGYSSEHVCATELGSTSVGSARAHFRILSIIFRHTQLHVFLSFLFFLNNSFYFSFRRLRVFFFLVLFCYFFLNIPIYSQWHSKPLRQ